MPQLTIGSRIEWEPELHSRLTAFVRANETTQREVIHRAVEELLDREERGKHRDNAH